MSFTFRLATTMFILIPAASVAGPITIEADGATNSYTKFIEAFGMPTYSVPDQCLPEHPSRHITEEYDNAVDSYVFKFHAHVIAAIDRKDCATGATDRQRTEIYVDGGSASYLKGRRGEIQSFRWKFKLPSAFQPQKRFTHIFQLKAVGGSDTSHPILTFTPRKGSPDFLEVLYNPGDSASYRALTSIPLSDVAGDWIEAYVWVRHAYYNDPAGPDGEIRIVLRRLDDGDTVLSWSQTPIRVWRDGASFNRIHLGIYRHILDKDGNLNLDEIRDEHPRFADICFAKGGDRCPSHFDSPAPLPPAPPEPCLYDPNWRLAIPCD